MLLHHVRDPGAPTRWREMGRQATSRALDSSVQRLSLGDEQTV
jgi:hypothetical protein